MERNVAKGLWVMATSSNGNIFRVTGPLWGQFTGPWWISLTKTSDAELWCFLWSAPEQTVDLHPNKRLSKHSRRRWLETPLRLLWLHCNCKAEHWLIFAAHDRWSSSLPKWLLMIQILGSRHRALSLWKVEPASNTETDRLFPTTRRVPNIVCFMAVTQYLNWCMCQYDIL